MLYSLFVQNFHFALSKLFWKKVSDERIDYYYSYIINFSIFPLITFLFLYPFSVNLRLLLSVNVTSLPKTVGQNYLNASWTSGSMIYLHNQSGWQFDHSNMTENRRRVLDSLIVKNITRTYGLYIE